MFPFKLITTLSLWCCSNWSEKVFILPPLIITVNDFKGFTIFNRFTSGVKRSHSTSKNKHVNILWKSKEKSVNAKWCVGFELCLSEKKNFSTKFMSLWPKTNSKVPCWSEKCIRSFHLSSLSHYPRKASTYRIQINLFHNAYHKSLLNNMLKPRRQSWAQA